MELYTDDWTTIHHGDCLEVMAEMPPESMDAIVTDPPYGLSFMGRDWDHGVPGEHFWREALRVAKPGAHLVAFGGTRTFHRLTVAIEDAGWEIRDCLGWLYGSGFPKSLDVSKAIDKAAGAEREVVGEYEVTRDMSGGSWSDLHGKPNNAIRVNITAPSTEAAQRWQGWGTALKPAWEPCIVGYRPLQPEQLFAILAEEIRRHLWSLSPASDAANSSSDTLPRSSEVARSVPDLARTYELANSGNVRFVARRFTSPQPEQGKARGGSVPLGVRPSGSPTADTTPEIETLLGRVGAFTSRLLATGWSGSEADTWESIASSWNSISDDLLSVANKCTTSTGTRLTIELRTLLSCLAQITSTTTGLSASNLPLSPAWEPIILARKPLTGTVAANVQRYGTGALNIDGCRVAWATDTERSEVNARTAPNSRHIPENSNGSTGWGSGRVRSRDDLTSPAGRWPANIVHDGSDEVLAVFPQTTSGKMMPTPVDAGERGVYAANAAFTTMETYGDSGSAARFFYTAKASKSERDDGLYGFEERSAAEMTGRTEGSPVLANPRASSTCARRNFHPTVKPLDLMRWLVRLVTPPDGVVLDPFMGSGTTLKAARAEGHRSIGIDLEADHCEIAWGRLSQTTLC